LNPDLSADAEPVEKTVGDQPSRSKIRAFAQGLLSRREYAVLELRARLFKKWPDSDETGQAIDDVISDLRREDLLSDQRFAESFIRFRCQRFQGPFKIHADLRKRMVPQDIIDSCLGRVEDGWDKLAADWLAKQTYEALDYAEKGKYYRRLTSRGFNHQQAMNALDRFQTGRSSTDSP
jgi:regulatory protein